MIIKTLALLTVLSTTILSTSAMAEDTVPTLDQRVTSIESILLSTPFGLFQRVADQSKVSKALTAITKQQQDALNVHHDQIITLYNTTVSQAATIAAQEARIAALEAQIALLLNNG